MTISPARAVSRSPPFPPLPPATSLGPRPSSARCAPDEPSRSPVPDRPPFGVLLVTGGLTHQEGYGLGFRADPRCRLIGVADDAGITPQRAALNLRLAEELQIPVLPD